MESKFNGITLRNLSNQLNTPISTLRADIIYAMSQIDAVGLVPTIQTIFDDSIDMKLLHDSSNSDAIQINLCHLFGIMFTFKCSMNLTHISNINNNNKNETESKIKYDIDLNIMELFEQQNENNKYNLCCKLLDHIKVCKQQSPLIFLYHDDNINNNNNMDEIAVRNDKIWKECKVGIKTKIISSSREISATSKYQHTTRVSPKNKNKSNSRKNAVFSLKIPKKALGPYHDKNYHLFGRQYNLPSMSMEEVIKHKTKDSCWIIVHGLILDVTAFLHHHPASAQCILKNAGKDCDRHFKFHSKIAQKLFWKFVIGKVEKQNDCIIQ